MMKNPSIRFLDHIRIDASSVEEVVRARLAGNLGAVSVEWHAKVATALRLTDRMQEGFDVLANSFPWHARLKGREWASAVATAKAELFSVGDEIRRVQRDIDQNATHLNLWLEGVAEENQCVAIGAYYGFAALRLVFYTQQVAGLIVDDENHPVIRLYCDLPRLHNEWFRCLPYRSTTGTIFCNEARFLKCEVGETEATSRKLVMPARLADIYQDAFPLPKELYYSWVLPQWFHRIDSEPPRYSACRTFAVLDEGMHNRRALHGNASPWRDVPEESDFAMDPTSTYVGVEEADAHRIPLRNKGWYTVLGPDAVQQNLKAGDNQNRWISTETNLNQAEQAAHAMRITWDQIEPRKNNFWYSYNDSDAVIVFVHGIFSDSKGCWYHKEKGGSATGVFWPDLILDDTRFGSPSVYLGGFYTAIDAGRYEIKNAAEELFAALLREDGEGREPPINKKHIIFVCHSTGGIVARYLLERHEDDFKDKDLVGTVLIASPSYGARMADRLKPLSELYNQSLGAQLEWGHWSLRDLDDRFKDMVNDRAKHIPNLKGIEGYENHFILHRRLLPDRTVLVTEESAGRYFGAPVHLRNTDHFSTVKPHGVDHPAHELLVDFWMHHRPLHGVSELPVVTGSNRPAPDLADEFDDTRHTTGADEPAGIVESQGGLIKRDSRLSFRLKADYEHILDLFERTPSIQVIETSGQPPNRYLLRYECDGVVGIHDDGSPMTAHEHVVEIIVQDRHPFVLPYVVFLTPMFHPNVFPDGKVCMGWFRLPFLLGDICIHIARMIDYQVYDTHMPSNYEASAWAVSHAAMFPLAHWTEPEAKARTLQEIPIVTIADLD